MIIQSVVCISSKIKNKMIINDKNKKIKINAAQTSFALDFA